jgi:hypothetical protein
MAIEKVEGKPMGSLQSGEHIANIFANKPIPFRRLDIPQDIHSVTVAIEEPTKGIHWNARVTVSGPWLEEEDIKRCQQVVDSLFGGK